MYVFNLFDVQSGGISLLFVGFCEAAVIGWCVGESTIKCFLRSISCFFHVF